MIQVDVGALGNTAKVAARAVGMGESKYTKAKAVVAAAEADPDLLDAKQEGPVDRSKPALVG